MEYDIQFSLPVFNETAKKGHDTYQENEYEKSPKSSTDLSSKQERRGELTSAVHAMEPGEG